MFDFIPNYQLRQIKNWLVNKNQNLYYYYT